jgi:hypothetical protein
MDKTATATLLDFDTKDKFQTKPTQFERIATTQALTFLPTFEHIKRLIEGQAAPVRPSRTGPIDAGPSGAEWEVLENESFTSAELARIAEHLKSTGKASA